MSLKSIVCLFACLLCCLLLHASFPSVLLGCHGYQLSCIKCSWVWLPFIFWHFVYQKFHFYCHHHYIVGPKINVKKQSTTWCPNIRSCIHTQQSHTCHVLNLSFKKTLVVGDDACLHSLWLKSRCWVPWMPIELFGVMKLYTKHLLKL